MEEIKRLTKNYPRFKDGRIDYSDERICFVLNCVIVCGDEILLAKRSNNLIAYPGCINGISGFIDRTDLTIDEQAYAELEEELGVKPSDVKNLKICKKIIQNDESINREWHVFVVLVELKRKTQLNLNWENQSATWYQISSSFDLKLMPGFINTLGVAIDEYRT